MSNLVIVAIPAEDDRVWKISSEKVPHLTLLFLGEETGDVARLDRITQFVEHAVNVAEHGDFTLEVDHRGTLGVDEADVLHFRKNYSFKWIEFLRNQLLQQPDIRTAYDSVEQFPEWQPHLTLGYPATPAKKDDAEYRLGWVSFDRIAIWTGDFEGPEFRLQWPERDGELAGWSATVQNGSQAVATLLKHAETVSDTAWSNFADSDFDDAQWTRSCILDRGEDFNTAKQRYAIPVREPDGTVNRKAVSRAAAILSSKGGFGYARGNKINATHEQLVAARKKLISLYTNTLEEDVPAGLAHSADLGAEFLEHYGVKGMRWGQRKTEEITTPGGKTKMVTPKKAAKADEKWSKENASVNTWLKVHNAGADHFNARIDAFNNKPEYKDLNLHKDPNSPLSKKYMEDVHNLSKEALEKAVNKLDPSPTGKYKVVVVHGSEYGEWGLAKDKIEHAVTGNEITWVKPKRDAQGRVISVEFVLDPTSSLTQTTDLGEEFLEHFGVKGMRWGVRKVQDAASAAGRTRVGAGTVKFVKDVHFESEMGRDSATNRVASAATTKWSKEDVPRLNAEYKGTKAGTVKGRLKNPLAKETIEYRSRSRAAFRDRLNEEVANLPGNASGTRRYEIHDNGHTNANYMWSLRAVDVKRSSGLDRVEHADTTANDELGSFSLVISFDADGFITGLKQVAFRDFEAEGAAIAQTADLGAEFILEHYGVKGMHWGVRRDRPAPTAVAPTATSVVPHGARRKTKIQRSGGENHPAHEDAIKVAEARAKLSKSGPAALSNKELRDVANRLQLEQQVTQLATSQRVTAKGRKFVKGLTGFNKEVNDTLNTGMQTNRLFQQTRPAA